MIFVRAEYLINVLFDFELKIAGGWVKRSLPLTTNIVRWCCSNEEPSWACRAHSAQKDFHPDAKLEASRCVLTHRLFLRLKPATEGCYAEWAFAFLRTRNNTVNAAVLADISVRSPRKWIIVIIGNFFSGKKYPKTILSTQALDTVNELSKQIECAVSTLRPKSALSCDKKWAQLEMIQPKYRQYLNHCFCFKN